MTREEWEAEDRAAMAWLRGRLFAAGGMTPFLAGIHEQERIARSAAHALNCRLEDAPVKADDIVARLKLLAGPLPPG